MGVQKNDRMQGVRLAQAEDRNEETGRGIGIEMRDVKITKNK